jgi:ketosteroid isomerase-like protein
VTGGVREMTELDRLTERLDEVTDAIERGDGDAIRRIVADSWHEDCEWVPLISGVEGDSYRGRDGLVAFFEDFWSSVEPRYVDREYRQVGNSIVQVMTLEVRGRGSDAPVEQRVGVLYKVEDGLIRRGVVYPSPEAALAAAELLGA